MRSTCGSTACRVTAAVTALAMLLGGCAANQVTLSGAAQHGGFVLHDENTTPIFWHLGLSRPNDLIATLYPDGRNVYLDGRRITTNTRIKNGAHVWTGRDSGALVAFEPPRRGQPCRVEIRDFTAGRILGDTAECQHDVQTPQGSGESDTRSTEYHIAVHGDHETEITLLRGRMQVRSHSVPDRWATVNAYQDVLLTPAGIIGPRPVSQQEIERRTAWRTRYHFRSGPDPRAAGAAAAAGAFFWYLFHKSNEEPPPPNPDVQRQPVVK